MHKSQLIYKGTSPGSVCIISCSNRTKATRRKHSMSRRNPSKGTSDKIMNHAWVWLSWHLKKCTQMLHGGSFFSLVPDFSKRLLYYTFLLLTRVPLTKWPEERLAIMIILNFFLIATNQSPFFYLQDNCTASKKSAFLSFTRFLFSRSSQSRWSHQHARKSKSSSRLILNSNKSIHVLTNDCKIKTSFACRVKVP